MGGDPEGLKSDATAEAVSTALLVVEDALTVSKLTPRDPDYWAIVGRYLDLLYTDASRALGADVVRTEEGRGIIQTRAEATLLHDGLTTAEVSAVGAYIDKRVGAIVARPQRAIVLADPARGKLPQVADPVALFNGQFVTTSVDVRIDGGGIDLTLSRTYRSHAAYDGPMGMGWTHSFDLWLRQDGPLLSRASGTLLEEQYLRHPRFGEAGFDYYVGPPGQDGIVMPRGDSFSWRAPDGHRHLYERDPARPDEHRVARIEDRFGNYLALFYNEDSRLAQIEVNAPERFLALAHDDRGRLISLLDHTGRSWKYRYDDFGDLVAVTLPATAQLPAGLRYCYEYSSSFSALGLQHKLIAMIDPSGARYVENEYGSAPGLVSFGRVIRQRMGGGEIRLDYEDVAPQQEANYGEHQRPAHATVVTERNGQEVRHVFNAWGNRLLRSECVERDGRFVMLTTRERYDVGGRLVARISPGGSLVQYLYGRQDYARRRGLDDGAGLVFDNELRAGERQRFGHLLAVVQRSTPHGLASLDANAAWGAVLPDVYVADPDDIVVKMDYEPDYGQLRAVSDPRFTRTADPAARTPPLEHVRHLETRTRFEFDGPPGDRHRRLVGLVQPTPTLPDSSAGTAVRWSIALNGRGQLERMTDPAGTETSFSYFEAGPRRGYLQARIVDPDGLALTTRYEVDVLGRVVAATSPKGVDPALDPAEGRFVTRVAYNELDQLVEARSPPPMPARTRFFYDRAGRLARTEQEVRDAHGVLHPHGPRTTVLSYNDEGNLVERSTGGADRSEHRVTRFCYDQAGLLDTAVLPRGTTLSFRYDRRGLSIARSAGAEGRQAATWLRHHDEDGRVRRLVDARGHTTELAYDIFGRLVQLEDPLGHLIRWSYDKRGAPVVVRRFERIGHDAYTLLGRTETAYDELQRPIEQLAARFDNTPAPIARQQVAGAFAAVGPGTAVGSQTFYDSVGRVARAVDANGHAVVFEYDPAGRLTRSVDALGNEILQRHDAHGNLVRRDRIDVVHDQGSGLPVGQQVFSRGFAYDDLDRLIASTQANGRSTQFTYDSTGQLLTRRDSLTRAVELSRDILGNVVAATQYADTSGIGEGLPLSPAVTRFELDQHDNLRLMIDPLGRRTVFNVDALDRMTEQVFPDGSITSFSYDASGHLRQVVDPNGVATRFDVDALGRVVAIRIDDDGAAPGTVIAGSRSIAYGYDGAGRLRDATTEAVHVRIAYDSLGRPISEQVELPDEGLPVQTVTRAFSDTGRLTGLTLPTGRAWQLEYDELDRLSRIHNTANGVDYPGDPARPQAFEVAHFSRVGARPRLVQHGNATAAELSYDAAGRTLQTEHVGPAGSLLRLRRLHDAQNQVRIRSRVTPDAAAAHKYAYDSRAQLADARAVEAPIVDVASLAPASTVPETIGDRQAELDALIGPLSLPPDDTTFEYDLATNRTVHRTAGGPLQYEVNQLDQLRSVANGSITSFLYDANGNQVADGTHRIVYDGFNRPVQVRTQADGEVVARFGYDGLGRRYLEQIGSVRTVLLYDRVNVVGEVRDGRPHAHYVHHGLGGAPIQIAAEGAERWLHTDAAGSVVLSTDTAGAVVDRYDYLPFGEAEPPAEASEYNPYRYAGMRLDPVLGSYDARARQYDPVTGRFLQRDPLGYGDGTHLYRYAGNDPLGFVDPFGTAREPVENKPQSSNSAGRGPATLATSLVVKVLSGSDYTRRVSNALAGGNKLLNRPGLRKAADAMARKWAELYMRHGARLEGSLLGRLWMNSGRSLAKDALRHRPVLGGKPAGWTSIWDIAAPVADITARLFGAPEEVTHATGTAAELTSGAAIFEGWGNLLGTGRDVLRNGMDGFIDAYDKNVSGQRGGIIQGYTFVGDVLTDFDFSPRSSLSKLLTSKAAEQGELGIFVSAGNYWGEVLAPTTISPFDYPREYIFRHIAAGTEIPAKTEALLRWKLGLDWPTFEDYPKWLIQTLTRRAERADEVLDTLSREPWDTPDVAI